MDTSALVKMIVTEAESAKLLTYLGSRDERLATSQIGAVELARSSRRRDSSAASRSKELLASIEIAPLTLEISRKAAELEPFSLRTLDAIHVATADELRAALVISYNQRMIEACAANGLEVAFPGAN
ncbi:type II toxin-antitoxin system VapC family toxin [Arthrobacter tecti]